MTARHIAISPSEVLGADGLDAAACASLAVKLLSEVAASLPLSSLTIEFGVLSGAGEFDCEVRVDKKTQAVAFTTLTVRRGDALAFAARGLFISSGQVRAA